MKIPAYAAIWVIPMLDNWFPQLVNVCSRGNGGIRDNPTGGLCRRRQWIPISAAFGCTGGHVLLSRGNNERIDDGRVGSYAPNEGCVQQGSIELGKACRYESSGTHHTSQIPSPCTRNPFSRRLTGYNETPHWIALQLLILSATGPTGR